MRMPMGVGVGLGGLFVLACSSKVTTAPPLTDCTDPSCETHRTTGGSSGGGAGHGGSAGGGSADGGGSGGGSGSASGDAAVSSTLVDVTFVVSATRENDATLGKPDATWSDLVKVSAFGATDTFVSSDAVMSGSVLPGVRPGSNWFAVQDVSGKPKGFTATLQPATVDATTKTVSLTVLRTSGLTSAFVDNVPWAPVAKTATVLISFTQKSAPLRGVSVSAIPSGGKIAYDTGMVGAYSMTSEPMTGAGGAVLIDEIDAPQPFRQFVRSTLQASLGTKVVPIDVVYAQDFVTRVTVDIAP